MIKRIGGFDSKLGRDGEDQEKGSECESHLSVEERGGTMDKMRGGGGGGVVVECG